MAVDPLTIQTAIPAAFVPLFRSLMKGEPASWPGGFDTAQTAEFTRAIIEHGMAPLAHDALSRQGAHGWPESLCEEMRREAVITAIAEVGSEAHLRTILEALAVEGVEALVMKGSALTLQIYPKSGLRPRGDSDLLVMEASLPGVRRAMLRIGCRLLPSSGDETILRQMAWVSATADRHVYDVHWSMSNAEVFAKTFNLEELFSRAAPLPALGTSARALGLVDALLLAAVHRIAHHHGTDRLIWLYDIHLLHQALSAEEKADFWMRADRQEVVTICRAALRDAQAWFGLSGAGDEAGHWLPPERLKRAEVSARHLESGRRRLHQEWSDMRALAWGSRLKRLRQVAIPPRAYIDDRYGRRAAILLPFLYLHRGVRGVTRLFRRLRP